MGYDVLKTTAHVVAAGTFVATEVGGEKLFPTYLVTADGTSVGAANALHVQPGTGATWAVTASSLPLPSGAATSAKQDTSNTHLATLAGAVAGTEVQVDIVTLPTVNVAQSGSWSVAVSSSALPTGASTAANQDTIILGLASIDGHVDGVESLLGSIDAKITAVNTGAVVVASSALPTGAATAARQDTANSSLSSINSKLPSLGQALEAASVPVVLTAAQLSTLTPVGTVNANQNGVWTVGLSASQTLATVTTVGTVTNLSQMGGVAIAMGAGTRSSGTQRVTIATDDVVPCSQSGTWNVGTVTTLPARAATTDTITAKLATDAIQSGTTALTPKFAKISASSSGNNTVVAAVTSKKIRVLGWNLVGNGAVNAKWQDGAGGTDLTGLYYVAAAGGGISVPFNPVGWFETSSNTLLNLNLSGAVAVGGSLVYVEV